MIGRGSGECGPKDGWADGQSMTHLSLISAGHTMNFTLLSGIEQDGGGGFSVEVEALALQLH